MSSINSVKIYKYSILVKKIRNEKTKKMAKNKGARTAILLYYFAVHNRCLQNI